jgi:hypothetical protein
MIAPIILRAGMLGILPMPAPVRLGALREIGDERKGEEDWPLPVHD